MVFLGGAIRGRRPPRRATLFLDVPARACAQPDHSTSRGKTGLRIEELHLDRQSQIVAKALEGFVGAGLLCL